MSYITHESQSAESLFRSAFERLKRGAPQIIPKNSPLTQNNVAREAGRDPSALKKARYPSLIKEIQLWVETRGEAAPTSQRQKAIASRKANKDLKLKIQVYKEQRDELASLLVEAHSKILELTQENMKLRACLPSTNVLPARTLPGSAQ
ncbi:TPA: hypothetical protein NOS95_002363 [Pseudomonas aeruginosa]|uniref:hypothetical protein n=1 Tax=Pseudomonas aeruginosa TaxID=287 RepID=UPI001923F84A|nr:hypothetical protein [Pseudomonas aeruginosa]MBU5955500.1 hypothetical protein [Pseudomonas aeruginosa]MBX6038544.1 hypothetical protein [Pseudomonas aeruginosa]MBX6566139.1 hypothetical protein [Pseudomonas aeruginosa]MBX6647860.1 hypothetical protein [Pseudomonas aeruginosa]MBX6802548.1 hypothetical protein [Pseudomonas aeruginosa]